MSVNHHCSFFSPFLPSIDTVTFLVEVGNAKVSVETDEGIGPLHIAADNNYRDLAVYLINLGEADLNATDSDGMTPGHLAVLSSNYEILKLLLEAGADTSCTDNDHLTMLHHCADLSPCKMLLEWGADFTARDENGATPFLRACAEGNNIVALYLLDAHDKKVETNEKCAMGKKLVAPTSCMGDSDGDNCNCFHVVASRGDDEFLGLLVERAKRDHNWDFLRSLFEQRTRDSNQSPVHFAARAGHLKCIMNISSEYRFDEVFPVEHRDSEGRTALHLAKMHGKLHLIDDLVNKLGADPEALDHNGQTYEEIDVIEDSDDGGYGSDEYIRSDDEYGDGDESLPDIENLHLSHQSSHDSFAAHFFNAEDDVDSDDFDPGIVGDY